MIILIDNDKLIHFGWRLKATESAINFYSYTSFNELISEIERFPNSCKIYIDSDLGNGIRGEFEAKKLFDLGFKNLYLTTGYTDLKLEDYPWLKGIVSKSPPF